MSDFSKCKTCGEWDFLNRHTCPPMFQVIDQDVYDEYGDDEKDAIEWKLVRADNPQKAAERFAHESDAHNGYGVTDSQIVIVKSGDVMKRYEVIGEMVPEYRADEIKEDVKQ